MEPMARKGMKEMARDFGSAKREASWARKLRPDGGASGVVRMVLEEGWRKRMRAKMRALMLMAALGRMARRKTPRMMPRKRNSRMRAVARAVGRSLKSRESMPGGLLCQRKEPAVVRSQARRRKSPAAMTKPVRALSGPCGSGRRGWPAWVEEVWWGRRMRQGLGEKAGAPVPTLSHEMRGKRRRVKARMMEN